LEVVTRCGHAYCEECYLRWLAVSRSRECPLCRQRLGRYDAYALVGEEELEESSREGDGGLDEDVSVEDAGHGAEWLVGRLTRFRRWRKKRTGDERALRICCGGYANGRRGRKRLTFWTGVGRAPRGRRANVAV
jgi:hypothetical protein